MNYISESIQQAREVMAYRRMWRDYLENETGKIARIFAIGDKALELLEASDIDPDFVRVLRQQWEGAKIP